MMFPIKFYYATKVLSHVFVFKLYDLAV